MRFMNLAEDKRGSQLTIAIERLRWVATHEFQMVGLSATIGTPEKVAKFLVGNGREIDYSGSSRKRKSA